MDVRLVLRTAALALCLAGAASPSAGQGSHAVGERSYAPVVEKISAAVVSVYASGSDALMIGQASSLQHAATRGDPSVTFGSGVIVDPAGWLITCAHIVDGAAEVKVALADGREVRAETILIDRRSDIAVLRITPPAPLTTIAMADSDSVRVGDFVVVVGNPYAVGQTVTHGVISAVGRSQLQTSGYQYYMQTDAAINPGNSGGALVDMEGRLVGVASSIYSRSGGSQGIGFAIPSNMASFVVAAARRGERFVRRPWVGARLAALDPVTAARLGLQGRQGALVKATIDNGPAAEGGLLMDDVITSVDGHRVNDPGALEYRFAMKGVSGHAKLGILRNGSDQTIDMKLAPAPETRPRSATRIKSFSPLQGATLANLSPALAEELGLDANAEGVALIDVELGTPAGRMGFLRGDVLLRINSSKVRGAAEVERQLQREKLTQVEIERAGQRLSVQAEGRKTNR